MQVKIILQIQRVSLNERLCIQKGDLRFSLKLPSPHSLLQGAELASRNHRNHRTLRKLICSILNMATYIGDHSLSLSLVTTHLVDGENEDRHEDRVYVAQPHERRVQLVEVGLVDVVHKPFSTGRVRLGCSRVGAVACKSYLTSRLFGGFSGLGGCQKDQYKQYAHGYG